MENYRYLPPNHHVSRLLASFTDVDRCETCKNFTEVKPCSTCSKGQCESCVNAHENDHHRKTNQTSPENTDRLTTDERDILESIRDRLTEKEFEDFIETARLYLHAAVLGEKQTSTRIHHDEPIDRPVERTRLTPAKDYDWSKHERFTAEDILGGTPERVQHLLRLAFTPRPYQIRMTQASLKKANSLVCLQTGAGKTNVSTCLWRTPTKYFSRMRSAVYCYPLLCHRLPDWWRSTSMFCLFKTRCVDRRGGSRRSSWFRSRPW